MRRLIVAVIVAVLAVVAFTARADALPLIPSPCDLAPSGPLQDACELANPATAVGAVAGVAAGGVNAATGGVAGNIFDAALGWFSSLLADTVKSAMDGLGSVLTSAPEPPIGQAWFAQEYAPLMVAGIGMCVFVLVFHLVSNMVRFRTAEMGRCFIMFLAAVFLTATAPLFIRIGLQFADALTAGFASWGGAEAGQLTDKITEVTSTVTATGGLEAVQPLLLIFWLLLAVMLTIFWMVLLVVRSMILYVGTLAVPFVLPSIIDGKARFARIYSKAMFGVIIAKPILIGTLCAGAWLVRNGSIGGDGIWSLVAGIVIVGAATFFPLLIIRLLLPAAAPVVHVVERGVGAVTGGVKTAGMVAAGAMVGGGAGAAMGAAAASASTPRTPPPRPRGGP